MKDREQGAWYEGRVIRIVHDPDYVVAVVKEQNGVTSDKESDSENKPPTDSESKANRTKSSKNKAIADYFTKINTLARKSNNSDSTEAENLSIEHGLLYQIHLDAE